MNITKRVAYRNKKILDAAKGESCTWPGCGVCDGTIVFAHSNMSIHGKSSHQKSDDIFGAFLCYECHHYYDCLPANDTNGPKEHYFMRAMSATLRRLLDLGVLK